MKNNISTFHPPLVLSEGQTMRERLHNRTRNLAAKAGRGPDCVSQADYEQAKRDEARQRKEGAPSGGPEGEVFRIPAGRNTSRITGESDLSRPNALLDSLPCSQTP